MNYLRKKIKSPNLGTSSSNNNKDLEDDFYDDYVIEAPPHPSELIALGVNPDEIDVNDPEKLRELYRKAKEEGKVGKINSITLAKQREKEQIEENKKTKEEWKFFDSLTARVELAVKESQKTLEQLKDTSAIEELQKPDYELILTADDVFKSSKTVKQEKSANQWINFGEGRGLIQETNEPTSGQEVKELVMSENQEASGDAARNPFAAGRAGGDGKSSKLYHRNMSSFEAASLQLEQQQQQQQDIINIIDGDVSATGAGLSGSTSDLIAKMTADFKSAIETNDKQFTTNPFDIFDPFETIVDDDISFPSPTTSVGQRVKSKSPDEALSTASTDKQIEFFNPFETVVDKDALTLGDITVEGPVVVSCEGKAGAAELDALAPAATIYSRQQEITAPNSTPMHNPTASEVGNEQAIDGNEGSERINDESENGTGNSVLNISEQKSTSIESVIESKQQDDKYNQEDSLPGRAAAAEESINANADTGQAEPERPSAPAKRFLGPSEYSAVPRPKPSPRKLPLAQETPVVLPTRTPIRQQRRKTKQVKKNSFQEDSSDSSDDDDRIKIVIKARVDNSAVGANSNNLNKASNSQENHLEQAADSAAVRNSIIVPLLPPPPSKSAVIKQNMERDLDQEGEEASDEVQTSSARVKKIDSFEDLPIGIEKKKTVDDVKETDDKGAAKVKLDNEVREIDQDDEDADDDAGERADEFVIPMTLTDEDDYDRPDTPLYDEDMSYQLEEYPAKYEGDGWEMMLRYPPKKRLTSNRFWKKIFVRLAQVPETVSASKQKTDNQQQPATAQTCIALQIFDKPDDKKPMQEIPIQPTYTVSEISSQQFDQFGKIFTIKLQYIFYKERVGVRQGQLARFIHTGHIGSSTTSGGHGVDPISIGSIKRMGAPIEHSPQVSQIIKLGCCDYDDIKQFKNCLEDFLFKMPILRDRALSSYKTEEVQMAVRDETYIELNHLGTIIKQLARVRLFFLSFLNGMPIVEIGINDYHRQGKEVVGRMDILPVVTEEWIRLEACELHPTVDEKDFFNDDLKIIKLQPPDATFFELLRFRVRPPRNRELPLQITANMSVTRTKVSINCEVMIPGCVSRKHGQIPCENVAIRIAIPDCWIYFFREEKHFRMGSKKSVNRRPGKVKGIERFLGGGGNLQDVNDDSGLIEVTSGQAKYEHHYKAIVWRAARWPKETQSAYVQNTLKIRLPLTAYDKMPSSFYEFVHVEYTMPATTISHTTIRSISVNPCDDEPAEKYVKYSAKFEYRVKMRMSINVNNPATVGGSNTQTGDQLPNSSPIVIMKQPDLQGDLQKEEDSDDDDDDENSEPAEDGQK